MIQWRQGREPNAMLSPGNRIPPELREAVNRYLSQRLTVSVISTSVAVKEARASAPGYEIVTDRELADYIAERAVEAGFGVSFDGVELSG